MQTKQNSFYEQWLATCEAANISAMSADTCARLMAIVYVFAGDKEIFTFSPKLRADVAYCKRRYNINGGEIPDAAFGNLFRKYASECEAFEEYAKPRKRLGVAINPNATGAWVNKFMMDRYGFNVI